MIAFDVSVPRSRFGDFRDRSIQLIGELVEGAMVYDFGHLADGGVHLNLIVPVDTSAENVQALRDAIYALTVNDFEGSFSAEHGVGPYNYRWYREHTEAAKLEFSAALHRYFDPFNRLGNVRLG
jgi:FAD/FMN-containing dehydrogenase